MRPIKTKILVLCTGNSCRSQIAQAYLQFFGEEEVEVYSAGTNPHGVNPHAIEVMQEDGLDISNHTSNHVDEYVYDHFDHVITVCDHAKEACPIFPGEGKRYHHSFRDPADATGSKEEILDIFRQVRDEIKEWCRDFVEKEVNTENV